MRLIIGIAVGIAIVLGGVWYLGIQLPKEPPKTVGVTKAVKKAVAGAVDMTQQAVEKINAAVDEVPQVAETEKVSEQDEVPPNIVTELVQEPAVPPLTEAPLVPEVLRQQLFWQPFQARVQANGFAEQMTKSSGVNCQVVRNDQGYYRIYFEFANEADLETKISQLVKDGGLTKLFLDQT